MKSFHYYYQVLCSIHDCMWYAFVCLADEQTPLEKQTLPLHFLIYSIKIPLPSIH